MARFSAARKGGSREGFLRKVVSVTMGCFFCCFRVKDSRYRLKSTPEKERLVSRDVNSMSSLFFPDESEDDMFRKTEEGWSPMPEENDIRELKDEAKFLKACGTLLETPVEILEVTGNLVGEYTNGEELNTLINSAFIDKLRLKEPLDESSTPVKSSGEWVTGAGFLVGTPKSSRSTENNTRRDSIRSSKSSDDHVAVTPKVSDNETHCSAISSVSPDECAITLQRTTKFVRFECPPDSSGFSSENGHCIKQSGSGSSSVSMQSPYPTPLHLTDEMQTPGTVFPAYMNNIAGGTAKIRSQYVYSVLNPIQHQSQWKELDEEHSDSNQQRESPNPNDESTLISAPMSDTLMDYLSVINDKKDEMSLSQWLKSHSANHVESSNVGENVLGMVAAHWNEEEAAHISPKWCGGNGIPNSTTKYKEDQKVSWHATPFEERLEKALSEDNFISLRKQIRGAPAVEFDEYEESDTASSQLQSSSSPSHPKSVVSF